MTAFNPKPVYIRVDPALRDYLKGKRRRGETYGSVLRRLLSLETGHKVVSILTYLESESFLALTDITDRYLAVLSYLTRHERLVLRRIEFRQRKRTRVYFADTKAEIEQSGRLTWPRRIPDTSSMWALTNMPNKRKFAIIRQILAIRNYTPIMQNHAVRLMQRGIEPRERRQQKAIARG